MKKTLFAFIFALFTQHTMFAQNVYEQYIDGKIYVKFTPSSIKNISHDNPKNIPLTRFSDLKSLFNKYGVTKIYKPFYQASDDEILSSILKIEFTDASHINNFIDELNSFNNIEYAEKVNLNKTHATPNDPLFASSNGSTHLSQINAQNAWNVFNGNSNITVAIVDNAIMSTHADLIGNIYTNTVEANGTTGVDDDGNGYIDDINGYDVAGMDGVTNPTSTSQDHGTHCAGIAGANTNNSTGVAAIGWNIKIIPVKCSFDGSSGVAVDFGYEGILYAVKAKAKIISCSWGNSSGGFSQTEQYVIDYAWNRGCLIFASAGNLNSSTPNYPGAYNHVFCVAAVSSNDVKSSYSNFGTWIDISAPGDNILSTIPYVSTPSYVSYSGTSMATPLVAGLAGLMLSKSPNMTRTDVLNCLSNTAVNIYSLSGNSSYVSGNQLGVGRIDAFAAMNCAATYSALPPVANFNAFLPSTCPGVNISFMDSSLYSPTSWSWTFQGGTPATSTSSNPSVQWSTAGNYSVSLTVTNGNGSNTKTKLSYITVSGPNPFPFFEGFQANTFLPTNWVANNIWNDNLYWQRVTGVGGFGTSTACAMFDNYNMNAPGERDEMRTPKFDFTSVVTASLTFDVAYARYNSTFSDTLAVKVSTNCGTSWTTIYLKGGTALSTTSDQSAQFIPTSSQWRTEAINISSLTAGQSNVMFSFLNHGHYGQPIYLDNINLAFPTPTLSTSGSNSICVSPTYTFNNSSVSATNYTWTFQGGTPANSSANNPTITYASPGTYTYNLSAVNGTASASVTKTITVVANPTISSATGLYCANQTYTIGAYGANTYTWYSSSGPAGTGSVLTITPSANITYTIIGSNGVCSSSGVSIVNTIPSPTLSVVGQTICNGESANLSVSGATSYSWSNAAIISSIQVSPSVTTIYTVTGTSAGCSTTETVSATVIELPISIMSTTNALCFNDCNGIINASTSGVGSPYTYSITSTPCNSLPCNNLCAGTYTLSTSNVYGCESTSSFNISAPSVLQTIPSFTNSSCAICADGTASVVVSGGIGAYTYTWLPSGGNNATANSLLAGCYTISISDANNCSTQTVTCLGFYAGIASVFQNHALLIYPNPANGIVNIELEGLSFNLLLYDNIGRKVLDIKNCKNQKNLTLNEFAKGIYFIEVQSGKESVRKKLLIE